MYISKRSLKHFVESRSGELINKYDDEYILNRLNSIIDNIENILHNYDLFEIKDNRLYFSKEFSIINLSAIRIVLEFIDNHYEIVTMHFQKLKTLPKK